MKRKFQSLLSNNDSNMEFMVEERYLLLHEIVGYFGIKRDIAYNWLDGEVVIENKKLELGIV